MNVTFAKLYFPYIADLELLVLTRHHLLSCLKHCATPLSYQTITSSILLLYISTHDLSSQWHIIPIFKFASDKSDFANYSHAWIVLAVLGVYSYSCIYNWLFHKVQFWSHGWSSSLSLFVNNILKAMAHTNSVHG